MKSAFVIRTTSSLQSSEEFRQCLQLLLQAAPGTIAVHILMEDDSRIPHVSDLVELADLHSYEAFFIAHSPNFVTTQGSFISMLDILRNMEKTDCLLPVAYGDIPERDIADFPYYTLRGLERYAESLKNSLPQVVDHVNPDAPFFLIRTIALRRLPPLSPVGDIIHIVDPAAIKSTYHAFYHSFSAYYAEQRSDILRLLPENVRSVLDIGCARGLFGKDVREKTGCRVVGVELNPSEAQKAAEHLDRVIAGDFFSAAINETFDCVSCLDVLEHVSSPDRLLWRVRELLNDRGYLLCSIPNIGHWSVVEDLLGGSFDYVPAGILSITHLRFFTERSARSLLENMGFEILAFEAQKTSVPAHISAGLHALNRHNMEIDAGSLSCLGFHILAQKIAISDPQKSFFPSSGTGE